MCIGLVEDLVEESVGDLFGKSLKDVRTANLTLGDMGEPATLAAKNAQHRPTIQILRPTNFMLAENMETATGIAKHYQIVRDGEILPFKDDSPPLFQQLPRRIRKKCPPKEMMEEIPVVYKCFDILYLDGGF